MRGQLLFTLCLTLLAAVFLRHSIELGAVARMVPIAVLLPTVCLLLVQIVLDLRARVSRVNPTQRSYSMSHYERYWQQSGSNLLQERQEADQTRSIPEFQVFVLLSALLFVVYLFGVLGGGGLFLVVYLRYVARSKSLAVIGAATVMVGFSTAFLQLLEVNLPPARLLVWLFS